MAEPNGQAIHGQYHEESTLKQTVGMCISTPFFALMFIPAMVLMVISILHDVVFTWWVKTPAGVAYYQKRRAAREAMVRRKEHRDRKLVAMQIHGRMVYSDLE